MTDSDAVEKARIYHSMAELNTAFAIITRTFQSLHQAGMVSAKYKRLFNGLTRELQAEINLQVLETLDHLESADWARYGKVRQKWEKYLKGPEPKHKRKAR